MKVLLVDKTGVMDSAHERCQAIATDHCIDLHLLTPRCWFEAGRQVHFQPREKANYSANAARAGFQGNYARGFYLTGMTKVLRECQPDLIQVLEEPWSVFCLQALWARKRQGEKTPLVFYTWENIYREKTYSAKFSLPYRMIDSWSYRDSAGAVCATEAAREVLIRKGYTKPMVVIPYGIDLSFLHARSFDRFQLREQLGITGDFIIGYVGRLLPMKGVDTLLKAFRRLKHSRLVLIGTGPDRKRLLAMAKEMGISERTTFFDAVPHERMPQYMRALDVLVLPSRTTPTWTERSISAARSPFWGTFSSDTLRSFAATEARMRTIRAASS